MLWLEANPYIITALKLRQRLQCKSSALHLFTASVREGPSESSGFLADAYDHSSIPSSVSLYPTILPPLPFNVYLYTFQVCTFQLVFLIYSQLFPCKPDRKINYITGWIRNAASGGTCRGTEAVATYRET